MQTTWQDNNWFENNNSIKRQLVAFFISASIVVLLMFIPFKFNFEFDKQPTTFELELIKTPAKVEKNDNVKPLVTIVEKVIPEVKADPKVKVVKPVVKKEISKQIVVESKKTNLEIVNKNTTPIKPEKKLPSSSVIFDSAYGKVKLQKLDKDFQARTGNEGDFKFIEFKEAEWNKVTKYLDEEIDKPRIDMNFYSMGLEGKVERLVDKITYKKRFVTRYGTKIDCVLVGIIAMCGWK